MKIFSLPNLTLLVALALSGVAAYYSIFGLTAIFAGAVIPIIIMGAILEVAKLTTTVWLKRYWSKCGWLMKSYLVPSVIVLAFITSMGIFGYLSKSHVEQGVGTGDVSAKVALIDERIKTQRENIKSSRDALAQMDLQVNNVIVKGDTEQSAARSVQIRKQQAKERAMLQKDIEGANAIIAKLNEERAPIASQVRKAESEVGPIKYIAAMIYGDNLDANLLERAVRWVIILLVCVFDPLAIALLLAANQSRGWDDAEEEVVVSAAETIPDGQPTKIKEAIITPPEPVVTIEEQPLSGTLTDPVVARNAFAAVMKDRPEYFAPEEPEMTDEERLALYAEAHQPEIVPEIVAEIFPEIVIPEPEIPKVEIELKVPEKPPEVEPAPIEFVALVPTEPETNPEVEPSLFLSGDYVTYEGRHMHRDALRVLHPELFVSTKTARAVATSFGISFPGDPNPGDVSVRVDTLPNKVFKFDGNKWIEIDKNQSGAYLDPAYLNHLITKIESGEYDVDMLSENEKIQIEEYLKNQPSKND